uniref:F-box domain-containing protein n=1 Tax=Amphilophus citrinellus TaxID=61819 RepID=A0A3Q0RSQ9_AMPCI
MASLLGERLFEISGQGPSPPKDFFQLVITKNEVTYLYGSLYIKQTFEEVILPKQQKVSHQDFQNDKTLQCKVSSFDNLERLPDDIMLRIMSYLELKETALLQLLYRYNSAESETVSQLCIQFASSMQLRENAMMNICPVTTRLHNSTVPSSLSWCIT